jgi:hypothetical protein
VCIRRQFVAAAGAKRPPLVAPSDAMRIAEPTVINVLILQPQNHQHRLLPEDYRPIGASLGEIKLRLMWPQCATNAGKGVKIRTDSKQIENFSIKNA